MTLVLRSAAVAFAAASLTGCVVSHIPIAGPAQANRVVPHAIFVNNLGRAAAFKCVGVTCPDSYGAQLHVIADSIRKSPHKRVLIRVHGGMSNLRPTSGKSEVMLERIIADSANVGVYPLFINWDSGLTSSYLEHLVWLTQGKRYSKGIRGISRVAVAPVYFVADVGRSATRAPFTLGQQMGFFFRSFQPASKTPVAEVDDGIERSLGGYDRSAFWKARHFTQSVVLSPVKLVGVFIVDAFGTPAWDNMHRRTKTMFRDPNEFQHVTKRVVAACQAAKSAHCETETYSPPSGAVSLLLDTLKAIAREDPSRRFTLIGHSMGAIVASEIVRTSDSLAFDHVVFMAAAASVREVEVGVLPYLQRHNTTEFYNLTLHPKADLKEQTIFGFGPNASLLEWIDAYLAKPGTDLDKVMGRYDTMREAEHIFPPDVRTRIQIKAFGFGDGLGCGKNGQPYQHGGFNEPGVPYWRSAFWTPGVQPCNGAVIQAGTPRDK
jgi:hypothetical protein